MPDDTPRWETLQREWNALIPEAQRLGVPRVREVKIGAEAVKYREERLAWLRGQIKIRGGEPGEVVIPSAPRAPLRGGVQVRTHEEQSDYYLRHDLRLLSYDVEVLFGDGREPEVLHVQSREPLTAMSIAARMPTREWGAEKMLAVTGLQIRSVHS